MFGYVTPHLDQLEELDRQRYQAFYCGLCHAIGDDQSQLARFGLTYDMTFLAMLLGSLYEDGEVDGEKRCLPHMMHARATVQTPAVAYAAAMTVALIYHKCLDDWKDDRALGKRAHAVALSRRYRAVRAAYPRQCEALEQALSRIDDIERAAVAGTAGAADTLAAPDAGDAGAPAAGADTPAAVDAAAAPDAAATEFGRALGEIFAWKDDFWVDELRAFGMKLGRLVYMMDALLDMDKDTASGNYNPFVVHEISEQDAYEDVVMLASEAAFAFEKLPLERDVHILQSVVYAGVWHDYNAQVIKAKEQHGDERSL